MQSNPQANKLRKDQTDAETLLWRRLRGRNFFGCKFRRQFPVGPYIADFVCLDAKLIVELDGGQHAEQEQRDEYRSRSLERRGYKVLRFWNCDVLENMDGVLIAIAEALAEEGLCVSPHPTPLPEGEGGRLQRDEVLG